MATLTSGTNFAKSVTDLVRNEILAALRAGLPYVQPGVVIPATYVRGTNGVFRFNRYNDLVEIDEANLANFDLVEGTTPAEQTAPTQSFDEFTAKQRGGWVSTSDLADFQHDPALMGILMERIQRQALTLVDAVAKQAWFTTAATYSVGTTAAVVTRQAIIDIVAKLAAANVLRVGATAGADGATQRGGWYVGVVHPFVAADIKAGAAAGEWTDVSKYNESTIGALFANELGEAYGVRWVESARAKVDVAAAPDAFTTIVAGQGALALGDASTLKVLTVLPETPEKSDPLGQRGTVAFKAYLGATQVKAAGGAGTRFGTIVSKATLGGA